MNTTISRNGRHGISSRNGPGGSASEVTARGDAMNRIHVYQQTQLGSTKESKGRGSKKEVRPRRNHWRSFNHAFFIIAIGLLLSASSIWMVKVPKTTSTAVPAH